MLQRKQHAFRPGTRANHQSQFMLYLVFCAKYQLQDVNPSTETICLYAEFLGQRFQSSRSVRNYISGVRLLHKYIGIDAPSLVSFDLELMLRALALTLTSISNQRLPISLSILRQLCTLCQNIREVGLANKCAILFGFYGLLHQSNLAPPTG